MTKNGMKGISPLIASVMLIAATLAIAGILTTWSLQFVSSKTSDILSKEKCGVALEVYSSPKPYYDSASKNFTMIAYNKKTDFTLENLSVIMILSDDTPYKYNTGISLKPQTPEKIVVQNVASKPKSIKIYSSNCGEVLLADVQVS